MGDGDRRAGLVLALLYVVLALLGAAVAVLGTVLVPWGLVLMHPSPPPAAPVAPAVAVTALALTGPVSVRLSYGVLVGAVGNYLLCWAGGRGTGTRAGAVVPAAAWLVTVLYLGTGRPEGDVLLAGSLAGLLYVLVGAVAAAVGISRWQPPPPAPPAAED